MRKSYLSDIKHEQFEEIRPLFESTHKKTAIQRGVSSLSYWRMARTLVTQQGHVQRLAQDTGSAQHQRSVVQGLGLRTGQELRASSLSKPTR